VTLLRAFERVFFITRNAHTAVHLLVISEAFNVRFTTIFCNISFLLLVVRRQAEFPCCRSGLCQLAARTRRSLSPSFPYSPMAALVASPLVLPSRDKKEDGPPSSSMFSTTQTTEQGLSRFTNNPITFVKASDPPPSSVPLSSKYEVLDDSKLSPPDVSKSPTTVSHQLDCLVSCMNAHKLTPHHTRTVHS